MRPLNFAFLFLLLSQTCLAVNYDIVYVRAPRHGDVTPTRWPEVFNATEMESGSDLMLLHPDGGEEVLFAAGNGGVVDPAVSFDAKEIYFSYFPDLRDSALNFQRNSAPIQGADIYKINLQTRVVTRLTTQTWTPPSGAVVWSANHLSAGAPEQSYLGYGIFNLGPCPLPGGKLMFVSSRDGYRPNRDFAFPNLRLYRMDSDGKNVEAIGHLNIGSALHPTVLKDGRVMFASWEGEAVRDARVWGLWAIWPDGTNWEPLFSAMNMPESLHFQTQLSDERVAVVDYYNLNNSGFGTLLAFEPRPLASGALHGSPNPFDASNPDVRRGLWFFSPGHPQHLQPRYRKYAFSPRNLVNLSGFTHGDDEASSRDVSSNYAGKVTQPAAAPNNDVLLVYSGGPVNDLNRPEFLPRVDGGIYLLAGGTAITSQNQLTLIKNSPAYNEMQPHAVVSYQQIYGVSAPLLLPDRLQDGSVASLPAGTPFALVGTSSFYKRDSKPGSDSVLTFDGWDAFNTSENDSNSNWAAQGADAGKYSNADIHAVRIIAMEGVAHKSYGPWDNAVGFFQHGENERYRILGEIPLRKTTAGGSVILDGEGNPDTSFIAKIPGDVSFTFQTLDRDGLVLNMAQTWHQLRPGEKRVDCGGCHAHSRAPLNFSQTAAGRGETPIHDLSDVTPLISKDASGNPSIRIVNSPVVNVEYWRDIRPILQRSCVSCHQGTSAAGNLRLDDTSVVNNLENTYNRLANDEAAQFGYKPVISNQTWRQTNASRYIRKFQARRSMLIWKIFGRRLDGWSNTNHPSETVLGDASTLPAGANPNRADIDYTGSMMPPPGSAVPPLSEDEKILFARWVDLGAPTDVADVNRRAIGWFNDEQKPTLTLPLPQVGNQSALAILRLGAFDIDSGLNWNSLSVIANFPVNGRPAGMQLADLFQTSAPSVRDLVLTGAITRLIDGRLQVSIKDLQGNETIIDRRFSVGANPILFADGFE
jgi:hypothetical protein